MMTAPSLLPIERVSWFDKQSLKTAAICGAVALAQSGTLRAVVLGATPLGAVDVAISLLMPAILGFGSGYIADQAIARNNPGISSTKRWAYSLMLSTIPTTVFNTAGGIAAHFVSQDSARILVPATTAVTSFISCTLPSGVLIEGAFERARIYDPIDSDLESDVELASNEEKLEKVEV